MRRSTLPDWNRLVLEHPGEVSELVNATVGQHMDTIQAALRSCRAADRWRSGYVLEGAAVVERRHAVITGWACIEAPEGREATCECIANALPAELSVEVEHMSETFVYRGDYHLRM